MATNAIIASTNLDISKVTFGELRNNQRGGKSIPIKYNGQNLQIRLEKATYFQGINIKQQENGKDYTVKLNLRGCDPYAKDRAGAEAGSMGALYNFLLDLQTKVLGHVHANVKKIFGKDRTLDVLRDTMKQFLGPSVEMVNGEWVPTGKYPPSLKMKVPVYDGNVAMDVVDAMGRPVEVTVASEDDASYIGKVFPKRTEASLVVQPSVYVSGQGFGVTWRVTFARVCPPQKTRAADVFADEIKSDAVRMPTEYFTPPPETVEYPIEEDADEDEAEVTVPLAAPEPAPAPAPAPAAAAPAKNRRRAQVATA